MRIKNTAIALVVLMQCFLVGNLSAKVAEGDMTVDGNMPAEEMNERVDKYLADMNKVLEKVMAILKETRKEKDIIKLNCVNDKVTAIKGLIKVSELGSIAFKEAIVKNDKGTMENEFTKISISYQKVKQLQAEAEACIGEMAIYLGETKVNVEMDEATQEMESEAISTRGSTEAGGDTPAAGDDNTGRPPAASPFQ